MSCKKIVVCLDVKDGRTTKGVKFQDNIDVGDPVQMAKQYCADGADELVFYDIAATGEGRSVFAGVIKVISEQINIPFTVGGGISSIEDVQVLMQAGADKVSINSAAVRNPNLITQVASKYGEKAMVLAVDVMRDELMASGYRVVIGGGKVTTGKDLLDWVKKAKDLGAGEVVLNSIDEDGMKAGYDIALIQTVSRNIEIPCVASGGAGNPEHILKAFKEGASSALVASIVHFGEYGVKEIKNYLKENGIEVC